MTTKEQRDEWRRVSELLLDRVLVGSKSTIDTVWGLGFTSAQATAQLLDDVEALQDVVKAATTVCAMHFGGSDIQFRIALQDLECAIQKLEGKRTVDE